MTIDIQSIGLLVFIIQVMTNILALVVDLMLVATSQDSISAIAKQYPLLATLIVIFEVLGVVGIALHLVTPPLK